MMNVDYDDDYDYVQAADRDYAQTGYKLCDDCGGSGVHLGHKAYPSGPCEYTYYCDTCDGEGQLPIPAKASISRNKREGKYAGTGYRYVLEENTWKGSRCHRRSHVIYDQLSFKG